MGHLQIWIGADRVLRLERERTQCSWGAGRQALTYKHNRQATFSGSSAILGPSWRQAVVRRRGGGEDPWLCDPGFGRVCFVECK